MGAELIRSSKQSGAEEEILNDDSTEGHSGAAPKRIIGENLGEEIPAEPVKK